MMSMLCNCCVRELLILARTWFAFGLPSKTGCDSCMPGDTTNVADKVLLFLLHLFGLRLVQILLWRVLLLFLEFSISTLLNNVSLELLG
jgi:hypothetical protein